MTTPAEGFIKMDKTAFLGFMYRVHNDFANDLREDHDEWSESALNVARVIITHVEAGEFDE